MLTVKELAAALKVSPTTVYTLASTGKIPAVKVGRAWRFDLEQVKAALSPEHRDPWAKPVRPLRRSA